MALLLQRIPHRYSQAIQVTYRGGWGRQGCVVSSAEATGKQAVLGLHHFGGWFFLSEHLKPLSAAYPFHRFADLSVYLQIHRSLPVSSVKEENPVHLATMTSFFNLFFSANPLFIWVVYFAQLFGLPSAIYTKRFHSL